MQDEAEALIREKLRGEIMGASWGELVYQFARGGLLLLAAELDLLDVATAVALDARAHVEALITSGSLRRANEEDARAFQSAAETLRFQFVIVQPWVLAQPLAR